MQRTQAWERLHDREYRNSLSTEEFYNLMLDAGYSKNAAQKVANERGFQRLAAGIQL